MRLPCHQPLCLPLQHLGMLSLDLPLSLRLNITNIISKEIHKIYKMDQITYTLYLCYTFEIHVHLFLRVIAFIQLGQ